MVTNRSYPSKVIPGEDLVPVILSDNLLPQGPCRALLIGTAGNLNITTLAGNDRDNIPVQAGLFPIQCIKVRPGASGTAASNIWAVQFDQRIFDPDLYNFYVDFPSLTDKISGQSLTVSLDATRYGYAGGVFGQDVPVIESGKLLTNGAYTQLISKSDNISISPWNISGGVTITGTDKFQADSIGDQLIQSIATVDAVLYTLSFSAYVASGQVTGYKLQHTGSASGNNTDLTLKPYMDTYRVTVLGFSGGGIISFGFKDQNSSNFAQITITDFQVTKSPYRLPYVPNDTTGIKTVPSNNSNTNEGIKAVGIAANFPQLLDALEGAADGVELITNGEDWVGATGVTPPTGWLAGSAIYTIMVDAGVAGAGDDALKIEIDSTTNPNVRISFPTVIGARYLFNGYHKHGDSTKGIIRVGSTPAQDDLLNYDNLTDTTWTQHTDRFTAITTTTYVTLLPISSTAGQYELFDNISVKQISSAQGRITIPWTPRFDAADVSGVVHILTANDDATSFLFYNGATQEIHAYDGTNTAVVACTPVNGTEYQIILDYGDNSGQKMRLTVDTTVGTAVTHAGSFPVTADDLSIAWNEEVPQEIGSIIIEKEPSW